jgi:uncharacterized repeat protein (TIGR01451 family)
MGWRKGRRATAAWLCAMFLMAAVNAGAVPLALDWDLLTWFPEGQTNLSETYQVDGRDVTVTFSGNTSGLDNQGTLSPRIADGPNDGGLVPAENALVISTDYAVGVTTRFVDVTIDLSQFPGGVENLSFAVFDVDQNLAFTDAVTVTAIANGVVADPTTLTTGPSNALDPVSPTNTIVGTGFAAAGDDSGNIFVEFATTGITEITLRYANRGPTTNAGLQTISLHDLNFGFVQADISVTKTVDNATPSAGDTVVYTVTVNNAGPDAGTGLEVTDSLPSGLAYVSDDSGGAYDPVTGVWAVGALATGANATLAITATVLPVGDYDNVAELTAANEFDPDSTPGNNDPTEDDQDNAPITPTVFADLSLDKTVDNPEPLVGTNVTYTLTLTNAGPLATTGVTVADTLPSGLDYVSDTPSAGSYDAATGIWTVGALANGASETLQITATVLATGDYTNVAEVTASDLPDPDSTPGNGDPAEDDQSQASIAPPAIGVAKSVSSAPFNNGDGTYTLTYAVLASNFGTVPLSDLQITDDLAATFAGATGFVVDTVASTDFAVNPAYDGAADTNLLAGTDALAVGATGQVAITVILTPGANLGPYVNQAFASGNGPLGTPVTDASQLGVNPDPDSDGDPTNNNDPTPVTITPVLEQIGLAKRLVTDPPVNNGDGSFTFDMAFVLSNTGAVLLNNVQIIDRLSDTFNGANGFSVDAIASADFAVNPNFNGDADINLLAGTDTLVVGASGEVVITLTVDAGSNLGPYQNTAIGSGVSPSANTVTDDSTDGLAPDPDGDGDPGNNSVPTPIPFGENPQVGVAKSVSVAPVNNGDGTFTFGYSILVENSGNVILSDLQLTDDLATAFAAADGFTIDSLGSANLTVNPAFDGAGDQNLLAGVDTLAVGATATVTVALTVDPGANLGTFSNTAFGFGTSPADNTVQDQSQDGVDPDPDNDDNPGNNDTPTTVTLGFNPGIGAAKALVGQPVDNNNGSFTFSYTIAVENTGDVLLNAVQVTDDLSATFADAQSFVVNAVQSDDLAVNNGFNGAGDSALLAGTDSLVIGARGEVQVTLTVVPGAFAGPYLNTAVAEGTSPADMVVQDQSTDGADVDPDNDGNPGNDNEPTPVSFTVTMLLVNKSVQPAQVSVGELVRYTVTVENTGNAPFLDLTLVDLIPAGFTYVSGSERLSNGNPLVSGERPVNFSDIDLNAGQTITLNYILRVGAGVVAGTYANVVTPTRLNTPVGEPATAMVQVVADPDFEQTTIIGKVFADTNRDGYQDEGEIGIPGVRLATVEGLVIETDANGRYHIAAIDGGFMERGRNFIVKVDPATLPEGAEFTTENPRVMRITQGLMNRFDFGVALPQKPDRLVPIRVKIAEVFFVENSDQVRPEFNKALKELAGRLVQHGGGKLYIEGNAVADCGATGPATVYEPYGEQKVVLKANFGVLKTEIKQDDRDELRALADQWRGAQDLEIESIGHTSSVRIAPKNRVKYKNNYVLGLARAQAIVDYLTQDLGLVADKIDIKSFGKTQPIASNENEAGRAQNRRVELVVRGRRVQAAAAPVERPPCDPRLLKQRAHNVYETLRGYMGDEHITNVEVIAPTDTVPANPDGYPQTP